MKISNILIAVLLPSCAVSYTDTQGNLHRVGFFAEQLSVEGELLHRSDQTIGLRLDTSTKDLGLSLGFREKSETFLIDSKDPICLVQRKEYLHKVRCELPLPPKEDTTRLLGSQL